MVAFKVATKKLITNSIKNVSQKFNLLFHHKNKSIKMLFIKKNIFLLFLLFSLFNSYCQTSQEYYTIGREKFDQKDYDNSIIAFTKAIDLTLFETNDQVRKNILEQLESKKEIANYFIARGYAKFQIRDFKGAEKDFWNVTMIIPDFPEGHFQKGKAYFELNEYSLSIFAFNETIKLDSNDAEAYFRRGLSKYELALQSSLKNELIDKSNPSAENYIDAINDFSKALEIRCCPAEAFYFRGKAKAKLNDNDGAIDDQTLAIKFDPNYAAAYFERGLLKLITKDTNGAMFDFNSSIKINPNASSYRSRGLLKFMLKDYRGAIEDCTESIKLDSSFPTAFMTRGMAKIKLNQKESGCLDLSMAGQLGFTDAYSEIEKYCNN